MKSTRTFILRGRRKKMHYLNSVLLLLLFSTITYILCHPDFFLFSEIPIFNASTAQLLLDMFFFLMICRKCSEALSEEPSSSCLRVRRHAWHPEDKYCPGAPCNIPSLDLGHAECFLVHLEAAWISSSNADAIRHRHEVRRGKFKVFRIRSLKKT